jgi:hypothetical protein
VEKIVENMKKTYLFETWERRKIEKTDMYFPAMLKFSDKEGFVIEKSVAPVRIMGSYETTWKDIRNGNSRFRVEVIPFGSMEEADEYIISKLCYVSVMLPRVDKKENGDRIIFGIPDSILIGRERNVYWCMQNLCAERVDLARFQSGLLQAITGQKG